MASFRFLYRQPEGTIGPGLWARASAAPVAITLALTALAWAVSPGPRDLKTQPFISVSIVAVHAYLILYGFALLLLAVAQYFVSAKRFNDLNMPPALAGLAPFSLLLAGAATWVQPRSEGGMPAWAVYPFYAFAIGVLIWNIVALGFMKHRPAPRR
ncbi:MAG TPA: hypothetical protein VN715_11975 [Roseiarcus sp.]|nr:hypothetical protein [Roseiarcus sp.]